MVNWFDLNNGIYQNICGYLDLLDIVNLAAAFDITDRKVKQFEKSGRCVDFMRFAQSLQCTLLKKNGSSIRINCMRDSFDLRLLYHFGGLITRIFVNYYGADARMLMMIDDAIQSFCRTSLIFIELLNIDEDTLSTITLPFPNVKELKLECGVLSERLSNFNKWFPKLRLLHLKSLEFEKGECIEQHFRHLRELSLSNDEPSDFVSTSITDTNVKIAIQLNPQLTVLGLSDDIAGHDDYGIRLNKQFLLFINRKLPQLNTLHLNARHLKKSFHDESVVSLNNVVSLSICIKAWPDLDCIPIKSEHLKEFELMSEDWHTSMHAHFKVFENFLRNNRNMQCLFIKDNHTDYDLYNENFIGLVNELQSLKEISIVYNWLGVMAIEAIANFLLSCKKITRFTALTYVNYNDSLSCDQNTFTKSFKSHAKISGFDANVWNLEFKNGKINQQSELIVSFKKCVPE